VHKYTQGNLRNLPIPPANILADASYSGYNDTMSRNLARHQPLERGTDVMIMQFWYLYSEVIVSASRFGKKENQSNNQNKGTSNEIKVLSKSSTFVPPNVFDDERRRDY